MGDLSPEWAASFDRRLNQAKVPQAYRPSYHRWVNLYLQFCQTFAYPAAAPTALGPFLTKLAEQHHSIDDRHHAAVAVRLLLRYDPHEPGLYLQLSAPAPPNPSQMTNNHFSILNFRSRASDLPQPAAPPPAKASWEREFCDLETEVKLRNYSPKTLAVYRFWVSRFQGFVRSRPTTHLSNQEVRGFLSSLAVQRRVSASSQNQAFNALLFFFRHVLRRDFGQIDGVVRAKRHRYIPVVLSRSEVDAVLLHLRPPYRLVVLLLYGCGLRLAECVNLRIHCFNLDSMLLTVHDGKGQKDRTVPLPARALPEIRAQMEKVRRLHTQDLAARYAGVFLPRQREKKYKNAAREYIWQ